MIPMWNEIRRRADAFAHNWRDASRERSESQSFYNDFFEIFGVLRRSVAHYEEQAKKLHGESGYTDLFWRGVLLVEQKSAGRNLDKALEQADDYFDGMKEKDRPRFILVSDFQSFELRDLDKRRPVTFRLEELPEHIKSFEFILEAAHGEGAWKAPGFAFPREWEDKFPTGLGSLEAVRPQLEAASREVLKWPRTLPSGEEIDRPELVELEGSIERTTGSTTAVLGKPGSGKSAFVSTLAHRYLDRGWAVLAIKADMLDADISNEIELQEHLALDARPSALLEQLAKTDPVLLVLDQVDALAGYIDLRTARLSVLLNLVRRLGRVENVHIVIASRTFEFQHDSRLKAVGAESISLELPQWDTVLKLLESHGVHAAGWPQDAQEVMRSPQALATYLTLRGRHASEAFTSYQTMLERLWRERVIDHEDGGSRSVLATDIANQMADEESLWLAAARFDEDAQDIDALEAAGILTRRDGKLGFTHQSLFDYALARNFAREPGRLNGYVVERQDSLFLRPKLWAALTYLRDAEPNAYHRELEEIWRTPNLRRHLRYLLIEFIGQQAEPTEREEVLMVEALRSVSQKIRAYQALSGSPGWFHCFGGTFIANAMSEGDEAADQMVDVLVRGWSFAPRDVEQLLQDRWAPHPEHDKRTWWVLQSAPHWTDAMLAMACNIVQRTDMGPLQIDHANATIGVDQPETALQLVRARLDHELDIAQARSAELAQEEKPKFDTGADDIGWSEEEVAWHFEKNPKIPIKKLIEDRNGWDALPTLAEQTSSSFLRILWPWFERCFEALSKLSENRLRDLEYPLSHDADFRFEKEDDTASREPALLAALRAAAEQLAETEPDEWLGWVSKLSRIEVTPVQNLIAHSFTVASKRYEGAALEFLLADVRRYCLRSSGAMTGTSVRLLEAVSPHWSDQEVERFESAMKLYNPAPAPDLTEVEQRRSWMSVTRRIKLLMLRAVPEHRLTTKSRRHIEEEERVFGDGYLGTRYLPAKRIGPMMDATAMARAKDEHVIDAFRGLPDETGHNHPKRFMVGGNVQLSSAFAEFSKEHSQRAIIVLEALDPKTGTRASAYALEAMSEDTKPGIVLDLLHDVVERRFDNEEFRKYASGAITKLFERKVRIDEKSVEILENWLAEPITEKAGTENTDDETEPEAAMGPAPNESEEEDCTHRSMLWGDGGISRMPSGDSSVFVAMIGILLVREDLERLYRTLNAYLDRCKDPQTWDRVLDDLPRPSQYEVPRREEFLKRLFAEVPGLVDSKAATYAVMNARRWSDDFADSQLDRWKDSERASARQTYGEIVARTFLTDPSLSWARKRHDELVSDATLKEARAGAALTAANLWRNPRVRQRAACVLVALLREDDPDVWTGVSEIFRMVDELTPEEPTIALLEAIAEKPGNALRRNANFVAERLATLLPHEAELVARVAESLISEWRKEMGDQQTTTAMAAQELVDLAVTLHRLGPSTREVGTRLFEELLEINALEARQTLDELDNRFREQRAVQRPRLARHRRRKA